MLRKRILVGLSLLPLGILATYFGGWFYTITSGLIAGIAAWEYSQLMRRGGSKPAVLVVVGGSIILHLQRQLMGFDFSHLSLSVLILASIGFHLLDYERDRKEAATDLGVTLTGFFYLGWIGAYMVSLRNLPEGRWWTFLVLLSVWAADICAYIFGKRWGRHILVQHLSPHKTWEGFWGGAAGGLVSSILLSLIFSVLSTDFPRWGGIWIGLLIGICGTLGDLSESLIKRQAGAKDSSNLLPGHGGVFDRIDSWIWMGVIGYYLIFWFWP